MFGRLIPDKWVDLNEPAPTRAIVDVPGVMQQIGYSVEEAAAPGTYMAMFSRTHLDACVVALRPAYVGNDLVLRVFTGILYNPVGVLNSSDPLSLSCAPLSWVEGCAMLGFDAETCDLQLNAEFPLMSTINHALMPGDGASRIANIMEMNPDACMGMRSGEFVQVMTGIEPIPLLSIGYELPWGDSLPLHLGPTVHAVLLLTDLMVVNSHLRSELGGVLAFA